MSSGTEGSDRAPRSGIRLLLVDGDPKARTRLRRGLAGRFDIVEASTAEEALALTDDRWSSVLLADYEPPDHAGVWLLEKIAKQRPNVHRVLMSSRSVPNVHGLRDAGVFRLFLAKPLEPETFSAYFASSPSPE